MMRNLLKYMAGTVAAFALAGSAQAGNILLTGHDVLLHNGQNGFDVAAIEFLRAGDVPAADYDIAVVGGGFGFAAFTGGSDFTEANGATPAGGTPINLAGTALGGLGYDGATYFQAQEADWDTVLGNDLLIILSHTSCGGCDLDDDSSDVINDMDGDIATAFNADMDIWGMAGANRATYYDFLPPGATATGPPIGGSTGFECTADGIAIGLADSAAFGDGCNPNTAASSMINGFPTHNRFTGFDPDFDVFEVRPQTTGPDEVITIGIVDAVISDTGIGTDDGTDGGPSEIPEPTMLSLFGIAMGLAGLYWRRKAPTR